MSLLLPVIVFLVALLLQSLFSGYEVGFISSNPIRVRYLAEEEESTRARRLLRHIERPDQMLTTLLIGQNLMVILCTLMIAKAVEQAMGAYLSQVWLDVAATLVAAPLLLIFSEIIPKSIFRTHPTKLTLAFLPVVNFFYVVISPLTAPIAWVTRRMLRLVGGEHDHIRPLMSTLEDVRILIDEGFDHGAIEPEEQEMIHSVIDLQTTTAKGIMVPRIAIQALPVSASRTELVNLFAETGRTRILIYRDSVDTVTGVVNAYSILTDTEPQREDIERFVREVMHVPDTIKVHDLFREMKKAKQHIAVVTDEYGGTDGLVTMEDILEEIFGEIQDEYDYEETRIRKIGPDAYVVDARMPLEEVSEAIGIPVEDEEVETIGGWLMHIANEIPAPGRVIEHNRFRMTVLVGGPNHVSRIRLEILPEPPPEK
jgi:CBS domain containing-hemolysin-like protein